MTNRIPEYLTIPRQIDPPSQPARQALRDLAQKQIATRLHQVKTLVQEQPGIALAAAFCIGILLGWFSKRR